MNVLINDKKTSCILCKKKKFIKFNNNFNYINSNITVQKKKCILTTIITLIMTPMLLYAGGS